VLGVVGWVVSHQPRGNALRETLESGEVALGVLENTYSPTVVELYAALGVDFVWIDLEHGGPSPRDAGQLEALLRATDGTDTELLVRVPDTDPSLVRKALDAGIRNVFLPRVGSAEELEAAVRAGRFEYDGEPGRRGMANPRASRWGLTDDYVSSEDESVVVGVTIETQSALDDFSTTFSRCQNSASSSSARSISQCRSRTSGRIRPSGGRGGRRDDQIIRRRRGRAGRWTRVRHG